jgi:hypothetical protein
MSMTANLADRLAEVVAYLVDDLSAQYGPRHVLFIDVEGYECEALAGAAQTPLKSL